MATVATISVNFAQYDSISFTPTGVIDRSINPKTLAQYCLGSGSGDFSYTGGFVKKTGDTMSGYLTLPALNPTSDNHAARKAYVDSRITSLSSTVVYLTVNDYVKLAGSTMTGSLILNTNSPTTSLQASSKGYVDSRINSLSSTASNDYLKRSGGTMIGNISMGGNRITNLPLGVIYASNEAVPKKYIDDIVSGATGGVAGTAYVEEQLAKKVSISGDTMTGRLAISPLGFHAASKDNITTRTDSGFFQTATATTGEGWPETTNNWYHLLASTHTNDANYYSMQFAGSFYDSNALYYRATNGSGTTAWRKVYHSGNLPAPAQTSYVDSQTSLKVSKTGDVMSGFLTLHSNPTSPLHAATKQYVDSSIGSAKTTYTAGRALITGSSGVAEASPVTSTEISYLDGVTSNIQTQLNSKVSSSTLNSYLSPLAQKTYVDSQTSLKVSKTGDVMTGFLTLHSNPTSPLHAATKQYVDSVVGSAKTTYTAGRALITGSSGVAEASPVTSIEISYLDGVTSSIQTQLNAKANASSLGSYLPLAGGNMTGAIVSKPSSGRIGVNNGGGTALDIQSVNNSNVDAAFLTFHRPNKYAVRFGLDFDNKLKVGGWSMGTDAYEILHQGNTTGGVTSILGSNLTASRALVSNGSGKVAVSSTTSTQLGFLNGVTSSIQSQLNSKQATITGGASTIALSNLQANKILISNSSGKVAVSTVDANWVDTFTRENSKIPLKFCNVENRCGTSSFYVSSHFISRDGRMYSSGYSNGLRFGLGTWANTLSDGFTDTTPDFRFNWNGGFVWAGNDERVTDIYPTSYGLYVRTNKNRLWATGYNGYGQLGFGAQISGYDRYYNWWKVMDNVSWFSVSNGTSTAVHCCAISNGRLYTWGYNGHYQLGTGSNTNEFAPKLINNGSITNLTIVKAYACGDDYQSYGYTFVIDSNKDLHFVGNNGGGQAGNNNQTQQTNFIKIGQKADYLLSKSWNSDGTTYVVYNKSLYTCGGNHYGMLGNGTKTRRLTFAKVLDGVEEISSSNYHNGTVIARLSNGTVRTWGRNANGQCGNGNTTDLATPYNPGIVDIVKVLSFGGADYSSNVALASDGTVIASGYNGYGNIGLGGSNNLTRFSSLRITSSINFGGIKDIDFWTNYGSAGSGLLLLANNGDLYATGYCNWGCGGLKTVDYGDWIRSALRSRVN
jgi:alpha-tubulin suppressor-like RCC1 family protein